MSDNNRVSSRQYWLDRIDEACRDERQQLLADKDFTVTDQSLQDAAIRSLGVGRLIKQREAALKRAEVAQAKVSNVTKELAMAVGIDGRGWYFDDSFTEKIEQEKRRVKENVYRRSEVGRKALALDSKQKELRDRVMTARRPKDYDAIESELGELFGGQ